MRGEGKEGGRFFLLSNSWLIQFGVLREKGRTILWKSVRRVPCSHWCPQLSSAPGSEASSQEQGWLSCVDHNTEVVSCWAEASLCVRLRTGWAPVVPVRGPRRQVSCQEFGLALQRQAPLPLPHSHPHCFFSPCPQFFR